jgi:uncharacterized protein YecT (DUF1311 family)
MTRVLAVAALLMLTVAPAAGPVATYDRLIGRQRPTRTWLGLGGGNMEIRACVGEILDREDLRLNRAYQASMARLSPPQRVSLRNAQRRWIRDRDAECGAENEEFAQSGIYVAICHVRLTEARADELERNGRHAR